MFLFQDVIRTEDMKPMKYIHVYILMYIGMLLLELNFICLFVCHISV